MGHNIGEEVNCFWEPERIHHRVHISLLLRHVTGKSKCIYIIEHFNTILYLILAKNFSVCDEDYNEPFLGVANFFVIAI